jgi:hypothetical protein
MLGETTLVETALGETTIFCRKLSKIAESCDHNIDPWYTSKCILDTLQILALYDARPQKYKWGHWIATLMSCGCRGTWVRTFVDNELENGGGVNIFSPPRSIKSVA